MSTRRSLLIALGLVFICSLVVYAVAATQTIAITFPGLMAVGAGATGPAGPIPVTSYALSTSPASPNPPYWTPDPNKPCPRPVLITRPVDDYSTPLQQLFQQGKAVGAVRISFSTTTPDGDEVVAKTVTLINCRIAADWVSRGRGGGGAPGRPGPPPSEHMTLVYDRLVTRLAPVKTGPGNTGTGKPNTRQ